MSFVAYVMPIHCCTLSCYRPNGPMVLLASVDLAFATLPRTISVGLLRVLEYSSTTRVVFTTRVLETFYFRLPFLPPASCSRHIQFL